MTSIYTYPFFNSIIEQLRFKINRRLELKKMTDDDFSFLLDINEGLSFFKAQMERKPAISNVNIEESVNALYLKDKSLEGVCINLKFYKESDSSKFGLLTINLGR